MAALAASAVVALAAPATAKLPPFEVELSSSAAEPASTITVTLTFDDTLGGIQPHSPNARLDGLLGLVPANQVDVNGRAVPGARPTDIQLGRTAAGAFEGRLTLPREPGDYLVIAFPHERRPLSRGALQAYPAPLRVTAVRAAPTTIPEDVTWLVALLLASCAAAATALFSPRWGGLRMNVTQRAGGHDDTAAGDR